MKISKKINVEILMEHSEKETIVLFIGWRRTKLETKAKHYEVREKGNKMTQTIKS